jgi:4-amino-4-deoxy-L-arabinose transferase-like glycosyltransferase
VSGGGGFDAGEGGGAGNGMWVSDTSLATSEQNLLAYVEAHDSGSQFTLTVSGWMQAAPYILRAGTPVLTIGGFSGQAPSPTLSQFEQYVADGQVDYVYLTTTGTGSAQSTSQSTAAQIGAWVPKQCTKVPAQDYGGSSTSSSATLYECGHQSTRT